MKAILVSEDNRDKIMTEPTPAVRKLDSDDFNEAVKYADTDNPRYFIPDTFEPERPELSWAIIVTGISLTNYFTYDANLIKTEFVELTRR